MAMLEARNQLPLSSVISFSGQGYISKNYFAKMRNKKDP